jgi:hypothetical protein
MHSDMPQPKIQVQILPQEDWGGNTTAMTADLSDLNDDCTTEAGPGHRSAQYFYGPEYDTGGPNDTDFYVPKQRDADKWPERASLLTNTRRLMQVYFGRVTTVVVMLAALLTPVAFLVLPKVATLSDSAMYATSCGIECEGILIGVSFKLFLLLLGTWTIFVRGWRRANLPKMNELRALIVLLLLTVAFTFWLFYAVRVLRVQSASAYLPFDYFSVLQFSANYVDVLLVVYVLSVFVVELRHLRAEFVVAVCRSPDGEQRTYSIGRMSIQRAALFVLEQYYKDFKVRIEEN